MGHSGTWSDLERGKGTAGVFRGVKVVVPFVSRRVPWLVGPKTNTPRYDTTQIPSEEVPVKGRTYETSLRVAAFPSLGNLSMEPLVRSFTRVMQSTCTRHARDASTAFHGIT
jgi:hypothetical protein